MVAKFYKEITVSLMLQMKHIKKIGFDYYLPFLYILIIDSKKMFNALTKYVETRGQL